MIGKFLLHGNGLEVLCRKHGISTQTFYHWRDKYSLLGTSALAPAISVGASRISLSYRCGRADLIYVVETSPSLALYSWMTYGVTQDSTANVGEIATATYKYDPDVIPRCYIRLRLIEWH